MMNQITQNHWQRWLPTPGNIIFTMIAIVCTLGIQQLWAMSANNSVPTLPYQCYLTDSSGTALNGSYQLSFKVYDAPTGGSLLWGPETHNGVTITQGLCNLQLGSMTTGGLPYDEGFLEISVNGELLTPRESVASGKQSITHDELDLLHGSHVSSQTFTTTSPDFVLVPGSEITLNNTVPAKFLAIFAGDINVNGNGVVEVALMVDGQPQDPPKIEYVYPPANVRVTGSQSMIVSLPAGVHTFALGLRSNDGTITVSISHRSLTVVAID